MSKYSGGTPSSGFFSKLRENYGTKFSNLSISQTEKDGSSEDDTLVHNAFVKYFSEKHEPYPEWLGVIVKTPQQEGGRQSYSSTTSANQYQRSQFQPVHHNNSFNNSYSQRQQTSHSAPARQEEAFDDIPPQNSAPQNTYQPRSTSRLQDLYNRSRQQAIPGSGYNTQPYQPSPARSNSYSTTGSRLRERMLNRSPSMNHIEGESEQTGPPSRATWGRRG